MFQDTKNGNNVLVFASPPKSLQHYENIWAETGGTKVKRIIENESVGSTSLLVLSASGQSQAINKQDQVTVYKHIEKAGSEADQKAKWQRQCQDIVLRSRIRVEVIQW